MKLVDKDILSERINKLKMDIGNIFNDYDEGFWDGRITAFDDVICALNTIEVKDIDLEKEINLWVEDNTCKGYCSANIRETAEHFFELGIKAQKGE